MSNLSALNVGDIFVDWLGEFHVLQRINSEKRKLCFLRRASPKPSPSMQVIAVEGSVFGISVKEDSSGTISDLVLEVQWDAVDPFHVGSVDTLALTRRSVAKPGTVSKTFWEHLEEEG